jgi:predicted O-linked N-acetylglucosamine transferase (SPINDLY family)
LGAWKKILINIPNARIFLKDNILEDERVKNDIYLHFADSGIEKNRIILQGADKREVFLQSYNKVDISLDTFPYGGGTTNLESIWMGVPILTLSGPGFLSRCGESINSNLGLNDWICRDKEDYVKKAINFSSNIELLSKIKKNLLLALDNNIIFSPKEFTFDFINLIKNVFIKHQKIKSNIY